MSSPASPRRTILTTRATTLTIGIALLVLATALGAWIAFGRGNAPFDLDAIWAEWLAAGRAPFLLHVSFAMNWLGGGWFAILVVPLLVAAILALRRRWWAAAYFIAVEIVSAVLVQVLKNLFGRARPDQIIVLSDFGSFPSGHVANAAAIAVALAVIFPRVWVVVVGVLWVLLMAFSRTYLGAHWLSDTLGGALVGAGSALVLVTVFAGVLSRERDKSLSS